MGLSEDDRKRIEEEELRRALREKYERELRVSADVRADTRSQVEVRGVTTEIYRDAKHGVSAVVGAVFAVARWVLYWLLFVAGSVFFLFGLSVLLGLHPYSRIRDVRGGYYIITPVAACLLATLIWAKWFRRNHR